MAVVPEPVLQAALHDPVAIATVLLVVVTGGLWFCTFLLWRATVRLANEAKQSGDAQAEKMERSALAMEGVARTTEVNAEQLIRSVEMQRRYGEMQLRPYLSVLIGQGLYQDERLRFEASPRILNTGHTPALDVRWRIGIGITEGQAKNFNFELPGELSGGSIIGPQQDAFMGATLPHRIPDGLAEAIKWGSGPQFLTVWGYVSYRDLFKRRHVCTFAQHVWWRPKPDGTGLVPFGVYLSKHNRTN